MARERGGVGIGLMVAALVLGACSGHAPKADPASDLAVARTAVPTPANLPGYHEAPYNAGSLPAAAKRSFAACLKVSFTIFDDAPGAETAHSPDFSKEGAALTSSVAIEPKKGDVDKIWSELTNARSPGCLRQLFADAVTPADGSSGLSIDTTETRFAVGVGSRSVGYTSKFTTPRDPAVFYVDVLFVARGRAAMEIIALGDTKPFDRATEIAVARAMYDRVG
jgi:hypothetical protein